MEGFRFIKYLKSGLEKINKYLKNIYYKLYTLYFMISGRDGLIL